MRKQIELLAARTQTDVLNHQCDFAESCDTIKEAKARIKRIMSVEYQRSSEMSEPIRYAQIVVDGECVYDFFAKGYKGEPDPDMCSEHEFDNPRP